ncbi:hypothetical protein [Streptomyces sp. YIM S03343]
MVLGSDLRRGNAGNTRRGRGPRAAGRGTALTAAALLVLGPALAACGGGGGGGGSATPTTTVRTTTSTPAGPAATAPADPAAATKEIKTNWATFFDPASSTQQKLAVLENGSAMAPVLQAFGSDQRGREVKAQVTKVVFTSPTGATVTYNLILNGATALPGASGSSVLQGGTWKVSVKTLCALVQLSGNASATALPGC